MIRSRYLSTLAIAALIGAAPAFAQTSTAKPLCSELNHPNAGKLAAEDTGKAKDHSSSAVHMDCIADSPVSASTSTTVDSTATTGNPSVSNSTSATTGDPSLSSSSTDASANGTSTNAETTAKAKKKKQ